MARLKLAVVGETLYAGRLAECIRKKGPGYLEVSSCKDIGEFAGYLENGEPDILLYEQDMGISEFNTLMDHTVRIALIDNKDTDIAETTEEGAVIFRYQPGEEILRQIFHIFGQVTEKKLLYHCKTKNLDMIAIYAPGGHELQLPFSISYASLCGGENKVLYVDLAEFSGMKMIMGEKEGENFSDLIYGVRHRKDKFSVSLQAVLHHTDTFDYIQPPGNPEDLYEIQEDDITSFLTLLKEQAEYGQIIWNCGSLNRISREIFVHCSKIICVVKEHSFGKFRKIEFAHFLETSQGKQYQEKVVYVSPVAAKGTFVQGIGVLEQLQSGKFTEQVKRLVQEADDGDDTEGSRI